MGGGTTDGMDPLPGPLQKVGQHTVSRPQLRVNKADPWAVPVSRGIGGAGWGACVRAGCPPAARVPVWPTGVCDDSLSSSTHDPSLFVTPPALVLGIEV